MRYYVNKNRVKPHQNKPNHKPQQKTLYFIFVSYFYHF